MIGNQRVAVAADDDGLLDMQLKWLRQLTEAIDESFDIDDIEENIDKESRHAVSVEFDRVLARPISLMKVFLGDEPELDGRTMGNPIFQPEYVFIVQDNLEKASWMEGTWATQFSNMTSCLASSTCGRTSLGC